MTRSQLCWSICWAFVVVALLLTTGCDSARLVIGLDPDNNAQFLVTSVYGGDTRTDQEIEQFKTSATDDLAAFFAEQEAGVLSAEVIELLTPLLIPSFEEDGVTVTYRLPNPVPMESLAADFDLVDLETTSDGTAQFRFRRPVPIEVEATVNGPVVNENATDISTTDTGQPRLLWEASPDQPELAVEWDVPGLEATTGPSMTRRILLLGLAMLALLAAIAILLTFRSSDFDDETLAYDFERDSSS